LKYTITTRLVHKKSLKALQSGGAGAEQDGVEESGGETWWGGRKDADQATQTAKCTGLLGQRSVRHTIKIGCGHRS